MPLVLHDASDLIGRLVADQSTDKVQGGVKAGSDATTSNDTQAAELESGSSAYALATGIALLEGEAALSGIAVTTARVGTTLDVGVVVLLAQVEAEIVDDVTLLHDVGAFGQVVLGRRLAHALQSGDVVGMGGGAKAGEDAGFGEEERAGADG